VLFSEYSKRRISTLWCPWMCF